MAACGSDPTVGTCTARFSRDGGLFVGVWCGGHFYLYDAALASLSIYLNSKQIQFYKYFLGVAIYIQQKL
jgi:hypothetical protein